MHYRKLLEAHKAFYEKENRAFYYDEYMRCKNWRRWTNSVPICETMKLFGFILGWQPKFEGDPWRFREVYEEIYPTLKEVEHLKIEHVDLNVEEVEKRIAYVFDRVADCTRKGDRYESTAASKILHTILPNLFVMWDRKIRQGTLGDEERKRGADYAHEFLPLAQKDLEEASTTCMTERKLGRADAIKYIRDQAGNKTLAKLADEYNYMKFTMRYLPLWET